MFAKSPVRIFRNEQLSVFQPAVFVAKTVADIEKQSREQKRNSLTSLQIDVLALVIHPKS